MSDVEWCQNCGDVVTDDGCACAAIPKPTGVLTREQLEASCREYERLLEQKRATIEQQAQELERVKREFVNKDQIIASLAEQLAASQARCREMEAVRHDYKATLTDAELSDKEYMTAYCSDFHADYGLALKRLAQLQATLAAREAERDDERRKLQDVCMAHGPALMKIHDLERELKRLQLTWTTARPTVAGRYWYKDLDGAHILMIERVHHTDLFVSYEGSLTPLNEYHGEFAGPIPLPTEAQQARGRSGGDTNHGAGT